MLTASGDRVRESDIAKLKFENINGVATLKSFEDGFLGESYNFFIPGKAKNGERSSNRGADSSVAVLVATR